MDPDGCTRRGRAGPRLHGDRCGAGAADGALRLRGRGAGRALALPGRDGRRRQRRDAGAAGFRVKTRDARVRRRAAGQHRRLPHLRLRADGAAVGQRLPARRRAGAGWSPPCRCSRPATSSAGPTRRPTTTSSSASRGTGTSWRSTSWCSSSASPRRPLLLVLAVLVFVPVKYVYPSRTETLWYTNMAGATAWLVVYGRDHRAAAGRPALADRAVHGLPRLLLGESLWLTFRSSRAASRVVCLSPRHRAAWSTRPTRRSAPMQP